MSKKALSTGVKVQMIIWALFMPVCLILSIWAFLPSADKDEDFSIHLIESQMLRTEPIGKVSLPQEKSKEDTEVAAVVAVPTPKETYDTICSACHAAGLLDAPKFGDKVAWDKRISEAGSFEELVNIAIAGRGAMPPKGGASLDDTSFSKVVAYISGQEVSE